MESVDVSCHDGTTVRGMVVEDTADSIVLAVGFRVSTQRIPRCRVASVTPAPLPQLPLEFADTSKAALRNVRGQTHWRIPMQLCIKDGPVTMYAGPFTPALWDNFQRTLQGDLRDVVTVRGELFEIEGGEAIEVQVDSVDALCFAFFCARCGFSAVLIHEDEYHDREIAPWQIDQNSTGPVREPRRLGRPVEEGGWEPFFDAPELAVQVVNALEREGVDLCAASSLGLAPAVAYQVDLEIRRRARRELDALEAELQAAYEERSRPSEVRALAQRLGAEPELGELAELVEAYARSQDRAYKRIREIKERRGLLLVRLRRDIPLCPPRTRMLTKQETDRLFAAFLFFNYSNVSAEREHAAHLVLQTAIRTNYIARFMGKYVPSDDYRAYGLKLRAFKRRQVSVDALPLRSRNRIHIAEDGQAQGRGKTGVYRGKRMRKDRFEPQRRQERGDGFGRAQTSSRLSGVELVEHEEGPFRRPSAAR